jgi:hypothetical protein
VSISDSTASNDSDWWFGENVQGSGRGLKWSIIPAFSCRNWRKHETLKKCSRAPGQYLNVGCLKYEARILHTHRPWSINIESTKMNISLSILDLQSLKYEEFRMTIFWFSSVFFHIYLDIHSYTQSSYFLKTRFPIRSCSILALTSKYTLQRHICKFKLLASLLVHVIFLTTCCCFYWTIYQVLDHFIILTHNCLWAILYLILYSVIHPEYHPSI